MLHRMVNHRMAEVDYMKTPDAWATWPVCPLIHRTSRAIAYLRGKDPIIYHGNIYAPKPTDRAERFTSHAAIIAAGWKVD